MRTPLISVQDALDALFELVTPLGTEAVALENAVGRVLADDVVATRDQPPFAGSAMDGYAIKAVEAEPDALFRVVGEAAAGHRYNGAVRAGQAVRIFTGAPVPDGADFVVIQEDVAREGDMIRITGEPGTKSNIRPAANDFATGDRIAAPRRMTPQDVALAASMNVPTVTVARKPRVAIISTGDELVMPGETPGPDQIIVSNTYGLHAMLTMAGADAQILPIARDNDASLRGVLDQAQGADVIVTIGGASVGDHDIVARVAGDLGLKRAFYKVAMRPGKPLMAGHLGDAMMIGLPGNPVSAMICGEIFVRPVVDALTGLPPRPRQRHYAQLAQDLDQNGDREHYVRAHFDPSTGVTPFARQDSALLSVLSSANCLIVRPPNDPPRDKGARVEIIHL